MKKNRCKPVLFVIVGLSAFVFAACMGSQNGQEYVDKVLKSQYTFIIEGPEMENLDELIIEHMKPNEKWLIMNGTYKMQLVITDSITIQGESQEGVKIAGPDADYKAMRKAERGADLPNVFGLILITEGCTVEIEKLTVIGDIGRSDAFLKTNAVYIESVDNDPDHDRYFDKDGKDVDPKRKYIHNGVLCGIGVVGAAEVTLKDITISGIRTEKNFGLHNSDGYGIYAAPGASNKPKLTVDNCKISDFQKNGIHINKDVGKVSITNNTIKGMGGGKLGTETITVPTAPPFDTWNFNSSWSGPKPWPSDWDVGQNGILLYDHYNAEIKDNTLNDFVNGSGFFGKSVHSVPEHHGESDGIGCYWSEGFPSTLPEITGNTLTRCEAGIGFVIPNSEITANKASLEGDFGPKGKHKNNFSYSFVKDVIVDPYL